MKRIIAFLVACILLAATLPVLAMETEGEILLSEDFEGYAENQTDLSGLTVVSGVDTRVINDNGNKALFTRAFGDPVSLRFNYGFSKSAKSVFSAKIKFSGAEAISAKIFEISSGSAKIPLFSISENGYMKLHDGKTIGGTPKGIYRTVTIVVDWGKQVFDAYVDKKCVATNWFMPANAPKSAPTSFEMSVDYEDSEIQMYVDDIRVYGGDKLPWETSFPSEPANDEVLPFTPTVELTNSFEILSDFEFNNGIVDAGIAWNPMGGGSFSGKNLDEEKLSVGHLYTKEEENSTSFGDITPTDITQKSKYIVDMRVRVNELSDGALFQILDNKNSAGEWQRGLLITTNSVMAINDGSRVGSYNPGEWVRVSVVYNIPAGRRDIYVNGTFTTSQTVSTSHYPTFFRLDMISPTGSVFDVYIDYIRIYTGKNLQPDSEFAVAEYEQSSSDEGVSTSVPKHSIMDPADKLAAALKNKTIFNVYNDTMYIDGIKKSYANDSFKPYILNGRLMMPRNMYSLFSADEVDFNKDSGEIKIGDKAVMNIGETKFTLNGEEKTLLSAPVYENNILYLPLRDVAEQLLKKKVTWDERGIIVISDDAVKTVSPYDFMTDRSVAWYPMDLIYRYMMFDNPTGKEIVDDVVKNYPNNAHPRIWYNNEEIEYILDKADTDPQMKNAINQVISNAETAVNIDYTPYATIGDSSKQNASSSMQNKMENLVEAYFFTGNDKYAEAGVRMMKAFAQWQTMGYNSSNLTSGHWAALMGTGYDAFYNYLNKTPEGREDLKFIRDRIKALTFSDHLRAFGGENTVTWMKLQDNFVGVIGGGLMMLCLAVCDDEDIRAEAEYLAENALKALYCMAEFYYPDGAYYESVTYSRYALSNGLRAVDAIWRCTGKDYGISNAKGFTSAGDYFTYGQSTHINLAFHDAEQRYEDGWHREMLAYRYNRPYDAEMARIQKILANEYMDVKTNFFWNKAFKDKNLAFSADWFALDKIFTGIETGAFTNSRTTSNPIFATFHGGWTQIVHDSLDLGSFIFESDGILWAKDHGPDNYDLPGYFNNLGYRLYRKRPEGENCLVINPKEDSSSYYGQDLQAYAKIIKSDLNKPKGGYAIMDLSEAYARDVTKAKRGFYFGDDRNTYLIQDEFTLKKSSEVYWFMQCSTDDIEIVSDTKAVLKDSGKSCTVEIYSNKPYKFEVMDPKPLPSSPIVDGQGENSGKKIAIHFEDISGDVEIAVKLSPDQGFYQKTPLTFIPMDEWTVPEGEVLTQVPEFKYINVDGKLITGFVPGKTDYAIELPYGTTEVPKISAESTMGTVTVKQAESFSEKAYVTMKIDGYDDIVADISFKVNMDRPINVTEALVDAKTEIGLKGTLVSPLSAGAQTTPEIASSADKMMDGDFATRCAQEALPCWFEIDLGKVMEIKGVALGFYVDVKGRISYFDIMYSEDGVNFTKVFKGESTGETAEWESLMIPGKARYIRLIAYGNSTSNWSSITEFAAIK